MQRGVANYRRKQWEEAYSDALQGIAPKNFDPEEWQEFLRDAGYEQGYLERPTPIDAFNAEIREAARAGAGAKDDIARANARLQGAPE